MIAAQNFAVLDAGGFRSNNLALTALTRRDREIVQLARRLCDATLDFDTTVRAMREAAERLIPGGRIFLLGKSEMGPIIGSLVSGVGVADSESGVILVRVLPNGNLVRQGNFAK